MHTYTHTALHCWQFMIKPEICWFVLFYLCIRISIHKVRSHIRHQFIYSHFKWFFHLMLLFFFAHLFLYSWYFCSCFSCNYYSDWCCVVTRSEPRFITSISPNGATSSEWQTFYCWFYFKVSTLFHFNRIEIVAKKKCYALNKKKAVKSSVSIL